MAKKVKNEDATAVKKTYSPTEIATIVNQGLIHKPNKKVVFSSFVNNIDEYHLILNLLQYGYYDTQALINITTKCDELIKNLKEDEIKHLNEQMERIKEQIKTLEGK